MTHSDNETDDYDWSPETRRKRVRTAFAILGIVVIAAISLFFAIKSYGHELPKRPPILVTREEFHRAIEFAHDATQAQDERLKIIRPELPDESSQTRSYRLILEALKRGEDVELQGKEWGVR